MVWGSKELLSFFKRCIFFNSLKSSLDRFTESFETDINIGTSRLEWGTQQKDQIQGNDRDFLK